MGSDFSKHREWVHLFGVPLFASLFSTMASAAPKKTVQVFGRKRAAVAVALCKEGKGLIRVNGQPLHLLEPEVLRVKVRFPSAWARCCV